MTVTSARCCRLVQGHHTIHCGASAPHASHHLGSCSLLNWSKLLIRVAGEDRKVESLAWVSAARNEGAGRLRSCPR